MRKQKISISTILLVTKQTNIKSEDRATLRELIQLSPTLKLRSNFDRPTSTRSNLCTNNHVERFNRVLRYLENVRYKWRRRKTIVRHILLQFQNWLKRREIQPTLAA
jgi:transposase-like protein